MNGSTNSYSYQLLDKQLVSYAFWNQGDKLQQQRQKNVSYSNRCSPLCYSTDIIELYQKLLFFVFDILVSGLNYIYEVGLKWIMLEKLQMFIRLKIEFN